MLRAEVSASTFSFFAGVVTGHENLSTPDFSRVQILTRCLRWSSITFDIEGVGKVTLALLSSPSFPFGGKRGSREKNDRWKIPKHRGKFSLAAPTPTPSLDSSAGVLDLTKFLQEILLWNFAPIIFQPITAPDLRWREILDILLVTKNDR